MKLWTKLFGRRATPNAGDVLEEAADLIATYGWLRGGYGDYKRGFCLSGAISCAGVKLKADTTDAFRVAQRLLPVPEAKGFLSPEAWNDQYADDKNEVVDFLRSCATMWRTEEGASKR